MLKYNLENLIPVNYAKYLKTFKHLKSGKKNNINESGYLLSFLCYTPRVQSDAIYLGNKNCKRNSGYDEKDTNMKLADK